MTQNEVLLDVNVFPDYRQVRIEDLGAKEVPDGWGVEEAFFANAFYAGQSTTAWAS